MAGNALLKCFNVAIDLKRPVSIRPFEVVEGDTGNRLTVTLTDDGQPVDMTGLRVMAVFSNSNGISVQDTDEGSCSADGNVLTIDLAPSSFAPGMVECELQLYSYNSASRSGTQREEVLVTSAKFNFSCRRAILNGESIQTTPQFPILTQTLEAIEEAESQRTEAEAARAAAEAARASAESSRAANETQRILAELRRASAESARASAEQERASNALAYSLAEEARASAEEQRTANETQRQTQEAQRQAAETARAQAMTDLIANAGLGVKVVSTTPTSSTEGERGRMLLVQSTGRTYICTSVRPGATPSYKWAQLNYARDWEKINDFTLRSDTDHIDISLDSSGNAFYYDEMRITIRGSMQLASGAKIEVNEDGKQAQFSQFMYPSTDGVNDPVTVITLSRPVNETVIMEVVRGGTNGNTVLAADVSRAIHYSEDCCDYSSCTISTVNGLNSFKSGTRVIAEGRFVS